MTLRLTSCATAGKVLNYSEIQCPNLQNHTVISGLARSCKD